MCVVSAWEGIGWAAWSSAGCAGTGPHGEARRQPVTPVTPGEGLSQEPPQRGVAPPRALCQWSGREGRGLTSLFLCMLS